MRTVILSVGDELSVNEEPSNDLITSNLVLPPRIGITLFYIQPNLGGLLWCSKRYLSLKKTTGSVKLEPVLKITGEAVETTTHAWR
jgi:hypothetical protein